MQLRSVIRNIAKLRTINSYNKFVFNTSKREKVFEMFLNDISLPIYNII